VLLEWEKSKMNEFLKSLKLLFPWKFIIFVMNIAILVIFYLLVISLNLYSQNDIRDVQDIERRFTQISLEQGLSQSVVTCILQDSRGFMWFGTEDGLNRFDGYSFKIFKYDEENTNTLSNNYILSIYEDRDGTLWIGTKGGGLNKFNRKKEEFINYKNDSGNINSLSSNIVTCIYEDHAGTLWLGTEGGGLKTNSIKLKMIYLELSRNNLSVIYMR